MSTPTFLPIIGGAEIGIHEIYSRLGKEHEVTILTPRVHSQHLASYGSSDPDYATDAYAVRRLAARVDDVSPRAARALKRTSLPYLWDLLRMRRSPGIDVFNPHFIRPQAAAIGALSRGLRVPTVLSLVGRTDVLSALHPLALLQARAVVKSVDVVVPISSYCLRGEASARDAVVVPYGVDCERYSPGKRSRETRSAWGADDSDFVLFTAQRLAPVKRVDELLHVLSIVRERQPRVRLVIAGQGSERSRLEALSKDLGVSSAVTFAGYVPEEDLGRCFASADAFVFHSMFETFGIVFAQAMASGLPIVAASTSCVPDVVRDGDNGLLVDPFDRPGFAAAIGRLIADPELRHRIATTNRERARAEFDWDAIASQYERLLLEAAALGRR